jgi:hypothetical protein
MNNKRKMKKKKANPPLKLMYANLKGKKGL